MRPPLPPYYVTSVTLCGAGREKARGRPLCNIPGGAPATRQLPQGHLGAHGCAVSCWVASSPIGEQRLGREIGVFFEPFPAGGIGGPAGRRSVDSVGPRRHSDRWRTGFRSPQLRFLGEDAVFGRLGGYAGRDSGPARPANAELRQSRNGRLLGGLFGD